MPSPGIGNDDRYPASLRSRESEWIQARRTIAIDRKWAASEKMLETSPDQGSGSGEGNAPGSAELPAATLGLAFSGGGIRSATFCLGFLQVLAGSQFLRQVDMLSTVSGGGYCGGFLGRWFARIAHRRGADAGKSPSAGDSHDPVAGLERDLNSNDSSPLRWLRESGRYMSPTSPGDVWRTVAIYLRNLFSVQLVLAVALFGVFLGAWILRELMPIAVAWVWPGLPFPSFQPIAGHAIWWSPWILLPAVLFTILVIPPGWAYWLVPQSKTESGWMNLSLLAAFLVLLMAAAGSAWIFTSAGGGPSRLLWLGYALSGLASLCVITVLLFFSVRRLAGGSNAATRHDLTSILMFGLGATGIALALAVIDSIGQSIYAVGSCQGWSDTILNVKAVPPVAAVIAVVSGIRKLSPILDRAPSSSRWKLPLDVTLAIAAILVATVVSSALATGTHAVAWAGRAPIGDPGRILIGYDEGPNVTLSAERYVAVTTGRAHPNHEVAADAPLRVPTVAMVAAFVLSWLFGWSFQFINRSSYHALYAARLTRAYLGATNEQRWSSPGNSVREVQADDDISLDDYRPHEAGGPLHLLNVTINETIGGESQVEYRDRKGISLALGPAGVSIGVRQHATWEDADRNEKGARVEGPVREASKPRQLRPICPPAGDCSALHPLGTKNDGAVAVEARTLGEWIAISGAAFTTGLGYRTSLGASFLLGLSNIRLGYWWDSRGQGAESRSLGLSRLFPVQSYLMCELMARFYGTRRRHWYLSDGGHFENTGCYELIRRRLPRIICCDCGADPDYQWQDLANLARKVRVDFNAEMSFIGPEDLGNSEWVPKALQGHVGPTQHIGKSPEPQAKGQAALRVHATLAHVYYRDDPEQEKAFYRQGQPFGTTILFVKPSLNGDEPLDLQEYARSHPDFPQQSTLDQDFDEAQWESYRKLGEHVAGDLKYGLLDDTWWRDRHD